jgi:amidase
VRLDVVKGRRLPTPLVTTPEAISTLASAVTLDEAAGLATRQMAHFLADVAGLSLADAIDLMSIAGELQICQVVDPLKTCRFSLPRAVAATLGITLE